MPNYIPGNNAKFNGWLNNFVSYVGANLVNHRLMQGDIAPITIAQGTCGTIYIAHVTTKQAAKGDTQHKNAIRWPVCDAAVG